MEAIYTIEMRCFILVLKTYFWVTFPILNRCLLCFRTFYLVLYVLWKTVLEAACAPLLRSFFHRFFFETLWSAQRGLGYNGGESESETKMKGSGGREDAGWRGNPPRKKRLKKQCVLLCCFRNEHENDFKGIISCVCQWIMTHLNINPLKML